MIATRTQRRCRPPLLLCRNIYRRLFHSSITRDVQVFPSSRAELLKVRNIGIIAHIDAGKTTTTERMLYYSGHTRRIGDVDQGSTVTDFLPAERARGITIQSAAITFDWPPAAATNTAQSHVINLIDTPGHADFTFEVLRSLRVLDGAICILDGVAGVEAQTEKVWLQANNYQIPKIVYINKLDRDGAAFSRTVKDIGPRLHAWPVLCQVPWWKGVEKKFMGIGDVIHLRGLLWDEGGDGKAIKMYSFEDLTITDPMLASELRKARVAMVERLTEHDEELVEKYLEHDEDHLSIPAVDVMKSLRKCLVKPVQDVIPVYAGASFRNIGVQPLLDAVIDLLPSPLECPDAEITIAGTSLGLQELVAGKLDLSGRGGKSNKSMQAPARKSLLSLDKLEACALAFKVVNDARRGVLVYVRVYHGVLRRNTLLYNTNLHVSDRAGRLLKMYASDAEDIDFIPAGYIGVIIGLKYARTGDTLIAFTGANPRTGPPVPLNNLQLRSIVIPPPVFFMSVEPRSLSEEKIVQDNLALLLREDPSLHVSFDAESGQTHLAGMGELHLEIAGDRLINDMKTKATLGSIEIGYREAILTSSAPCIELFDREVAGKRAQAGCTASVLPVGRHFSSPIEDEHSHHINLSDKNLLTIHHPTMDESGNCLPETTHLPPDLPLSIVMTALERGVSIALSRGPIHRFPLHSCHVLVTFDPATSLFPTTTSAALSNAARLAVQSALKAAAADGGKTVLMEPVMIVTITVDEKSLGAVVHDISSARGGQILSLDASETTPPSASRIRESKMDVTDLPVIDPRRVYAPADPFGPSPSDSESSSDEYTDLASGSRMRQITARVPLQEMVGYLKHLRSLTAGRGTFVMSVDRFQRMNEQRQRMVLGEREGRYA